ISKTINMPADVSIEDVEQLHMESWKLGLKAVAIYRDNSKYAQPLAMAKKDDAKQPVITAHTAETPEQVVAAAAEAISLTPAAREREELPRVRNSKTFKFTLAG